LQPTLLQWPDIFELRPEIDREVPQRALQMILSQSQQQSALLSQSLQSLTLWHQRYPQKLPDVEDLLPEERRDQ
jgi:hypothetical protein